ncbi:MAG: MBL fold metallo-hydrolase [Candidatus Micrarchaeota archaeon]|nr:MBL fold metallo-hydrolase [Candidatus Micrarchaeota archaeon]
MGFSHSLVIGGVEISLDDAQHEVCFVSHAHSDHTGAFRSGKKRIVASDETFALLGRQPQGFSLPGLRLHPAGHMLGARQLSADCDGQKFVYTGDFSLHQSYTISPAPILDCDVLMIDSTYALPHLRFPPHEQVAQQIASFVRKNSSSIIVFGAYARGKSQELVRLLNVECGVAPLVGRACAECCRIYRKFGVGLDFIEIGTQEAEEAMRSAFVAILPPSQVNFEFGARLSEAHGIPVKTAVATGWAATMRFPVDAAFPLSDHADFDDTMRYIRESGAKKIICANSGAQEAAKQLRMLGLDAVAKGEDRQVGQQALLLHAD